MLVGLSREAEDEVGPERDVGHQFADLRDEVEEAVRRPGARHRAQQLLVHVLHRQVDVGHDLGDLGHGLQQWPLELVGLEVEQPQPLDAVDLCEFAQQHRGQGAPALVAVPRAEVLAPAGGVLADQHQLAGTLLAQPCGLGDQLVDPTGLEATAEGRDGTEGAHAVAAAGDLEVRPRALGVVGPDRESRAAGRHAGEIGVVGGDALDGGALRWCLLLGGGHDQQGEAAPDAAGALGTGGRRGRGRLGVHTADAVHCLTGEDAVHGLGQRRVPTETDDSVCLRDRLGQFVRVALRHAAHDDDRLGAALLEVARSQDGVDRLLLGRRDERAGVDQHDVGTVRVVDDLVAVDVEHALQLVGVDLVAATPERHHRHGRPGGVGGRGGGVGRDGHAGIQCRRRLPVTRAGRPSAPGAGGRLRPARWTVRPRRTVRTTGQRSVRPGADAHASSKPSGVNRMSRTSPGDPNGP